MAIDKANFISVAKRFVRFEVASYRHSGGSRNPGSWTALVPDFRRCDVWTPAFAGVTVVNRSLLVAMAIKRLPTAGPIEALAMCPRFLSGPGSPQETGAVQ